jgi:hypothetical protein
VSSQSRLALWLGRLTLTATGIIFASVSLRFLFATAQNGQYLGMLPSPANPSLGTISIRVGYGIYTLSFVLVSMFSLATSQIRAGLFFVLFMMALLLGVRIANGLAGGAMAENPYILVGEMILLTLSMASLVLDFRTSWISERQRLADRDPRGQIELAKVPGQIRKRDPER